MKVHKATTQPKTGRIKYLINSKFMRHTRPCMVSGLECILCGILWVCLDGYDVQRLKYYSYMLRLLWFVRLFSGHKYFMMLFAARPHKTQSMLLNIKWKTWWLRRLSVNKSIIQMEWRVRSIYNFGDFSIKLFLSIFQLFRLFNIILEYLNSSQLSQQSN